MARFRKTATPDRQALSVVKSLQEGGHIDSVRTNYNYRQALRTVASNLQRFGISSEIRGMTRADIDSYLNARASEIGQKTLDMERQALQAMLRYTNTQIEFAPTERLTVVQSDKPQVLTCRAYTPEQVEAIAERQKPENSLATRIAYAAGLRAHELLTLRQISEQPADKRPALQTKWQGRDGERYTVAGKGGLVREVLIPNELAQALEARRLDQPRQRTDRTVHYQQHYAIGGGNRWSSSFTYTSKKVLGWSTGAHGVRHSYAQERMDELWKQSLKTDVAMETVSQELGHFRPDITTTYLR